MFVKCFHTVNNCPVPWVCLKPGTIPNHNKDTMCGLAPPTWTCGSSDVPLKS